ncbi:LysR family transcriptional regulator [Aeromonas caviae]
MDQLDAMRAFVRVAELESFTRCAEQTGIPKATLSAAIRRLEERMGTRLLLRTTRRVQLTTDGQLCYARCRELLADMEEFDGLFRQGGADLGTTAGRHAKPDGPPPGDPGPAGLSGAASRPATDAEQHGQAGGSGARGV